MPRYSVMAERTVFTPYFKTFEADTMEAAEKLAEAEVESLRQGQELDDLGWEEGDRSSEHVVKLDATTEEVTR